MTEHQQIQADLAASLRDRQRPPVVFTEIALDGAWGSAGRLDVVSFTTTEGYSRIVLAGYEVKASRGDLLSDLRAAKWRKYLSRVTRLYFAFPAGLARVSEIPAECGVVVRRPDGTWRTARGAPVLATPPGPDLGTLARLVWRAHADGEARLRAAEAETLHRVQQVLERERRAGATLRGQLRAASLGGPKEDPPGGVADPHPTG